MKFEIIDGLSNEDYHAHPALGSTGLRRFFVSPAHYWADFIDPVREQKKPTAAQDLGSAIHCAVLEPSQFEKRYLVIPLDAPKRPTKAQLEAKKPSDASLTSIKWWQEFEFNSNERTFLSADDLITIERISRQVRNNAAAATLFENGIAERTFLWKDEETGVWCKFRPDWVTENVLVDLKSTVDASPSGFRRAIANYGYHIQAAWYLEGFKAIFARESAFVFAAFEKTSPFACGFYSPDSQMLERARSHIRTGLTFFDQCRRREEWPGYEEKILPISLPKWAAADVCQPAELEEF